MFPYYTGRVNPRLDTLAGGGQVATSPLYSILIEQWPLSETSGPFIGTKAGYNMAITGTLAAGSGLTVPSRVFGGSQYGKRVADSVFKRYQQDWGFSTVFKAGAAGAGKQIFAMRNAGSADGILFFLLRLDDTVLNLYIGDPGVGFDVHPLIPVVSVGTQYHVAVDFVYSTKVLSYRINGGAASTFTYTKAPVTDFGTQIIAIGGDILELFTGEIGVTKFFGAGFTDALKLTDYNSGTPLIL